MSQLIIENINAQLLNGYVAIQLVIWKSKYEKIKVVSKTAPWIAVKKSLCITYYKNVSRKKKARREMKH